MKILVANLGSTSFKYCLYSMEAADERMLAKGGYERVEDHGKVIEDALAKLVAEGHLKSVDDLDAVGFKTVLGKNLSGCVPADERTLAALEGHAAIAPAHNPAYAAGIRQFAKLCNAKLVALFETSFYQWVPPAAKLYAVPRSWREAGIQRYGFHGASHKFIAERSAELMQRSDIADRVRALYIKGPGEEPTGKPLRVVSCHLGGSSSVTGIRNGIAIGTSMGLSPQSGLPQNNRVGDLDSMAVPLAVKELGLSIEQAQQQLTKESGLLGISGVSNDLRDIFKAADAGNQNAQLAIDHLVHSIRHYIGAYAFAMGGLDAIVFTAGIGENQAEIREAICANWQDLGIQIDRHTNRRPKSGETFINEQNSPVKIIIIPTNEELVVARETKRLLQHAAQ